MFFLFILYHPCNIYKMCLIMSNFSLILDLDNENVLFDENLYKNILGIK